MNNQWQNRINCVLLTLLTFWVVGYAYLISRLLCAHVLLVQRIGNSLTYADYLLWYMAAQVCLSKARTQLYDPNIQLAWWNDWMGTAVGGHLDTAPAFAYPPYFPLLVSPLGLMPAEVSYVVWTISTLALGLGVLHFVYRKEMNVSKVVAACLLIGVAASFPSWLTLRIGHLAWFMLALVAMYYFSLRHRRDLVAGVLLALISIKPQLLVYLIIAPLGMKRWKLLAMFVGIELVLFAAAGFVLGWGNVVSYPATVVAQETSEKVMMWHHQPLMPSLRGLLTNILPLPTAFAISSAINVLSLMALLWVWFRVGKSGRIDLLRWAVILTLVGAMLTSVHMHEYDSLLLALCAAITLPTVNPFKLAMLEPVSLRVWSMLLFAYPFVGVLLFLMAEYWPHVEIESVVAFLLNSALLVTAIIQFKMALSAPAAEPA